MCINLSIWDAVGEDLIPPEIIHDEKEIRNASTENTLYEFVVIYGMPMEEEYRLVNSIHLFQGAPMIKGAISTGK